MERSKFIWGKHAIYCSEHMAQATVNALAASLVVVGLLTMVYPSWGGINWIIGGVAAFVVGMMTGKK